MRVLCYKLLKIIILIVFGIQIANSQDVIINEVESSNKVIIKDCDGDYSDWIELHNLKKYDINLMGFKLSDDASNKNKWVFPSIIIPANAYLIVYASGKDKIHNNEPHTNFKIKQSGEDLVFSDINVKLISSNSSSEIRYTLNGSVPTSNSRLYSGSILLTNNSLTPYFISGIPTTPTTGPARWDVFKWKKPESVYKCNVLRFASFENGKMKSEVYSKTYFIDPEIRNRYSFPILSLITDSLNFFDNDSGIYIPGKRYDDIGATTWWPEGNYRGKGRLWEREIHLSFFEKDGGIAFETNAGVRIKGYGSASYTQKSLNIYFRSEYGQSAVEYSIFNRGKAKKFKRISLRNSGSDYLYTLFRDAMLQEVMSTMNLEKQDYQPAILFINGEYWGIHNIREKYDDNYFAYKYGKDKDSINILGICGDVEEGSDVDYLELMDFIDNNDISLDVNYAHVAEKVDIDNFID